MARIQIENIHKTFGKVKALDGVSLDVKDKEFFVLFGPAGAGKTTILNCIAGIEMPQEGIVKYDGKVMNQIDPADRNVAMVFENYALYPHMTVYDNIASPMRSKRYHEDETVIKQKVEHVAKIMKMEKLLERLPAQLSNGQKQRVAMGRALVRNPNVFLMDEPLAHLDAKLRNSMRTELKEMQAEFGTTSIYVTHDFMEAMSLGDRIAIINKGKIVQIGTPDAIYYLPLNEFVSQMMGEPDINIIHGELLEEGSSFQVRLKDSGVVFSLPFEQELYAMISGYTGRNIDLGVRPQNVHYTFKPEDGYFEAKVYSYESLGNKSVIEANLGELMFRMIAPNGLTVKIDQPVYLKMDIDHAMFFDAETTNYIGRYNEKNIRMIAEGQEDK